MDTIQKAVREYRTRKWRVLFYYLDRNGDDILDEEEVARLPKQLLQIGGETHGNQFIKLTDELWRRTKEALGKSPTDNTFTVEEWIKAMDVVGVSAFFVETLMPTSAQLYFELVDTNKDGMISMDEWRKFQTLRGVSDESVIASTFQRLDTDRDGSINPDEMRHGFIQFGKGDDPSEDYSFLFATAKAIKAGIIIP